METNSKCCYLVHEAEDECPAFDVKRGRDCCYDSHTEKDECSDRWEVNAL